MEMESSVLPDADSLFYRGGKDNYTEEEDRKVDQTYVRSYRAVAVLSDDSEEYVIKIFSCNTESLLKEFKIPKSFLSLDFLDPFAFKQTASEDDAQELLKTAIQESENEDASLLEESYDSAMSEEEMKEYYLSGKLPYPILAPEDERYLIIISQIEEGIESSIPSNAKKRLILSNMKYADFMAYRRYSSCHGKESISIEDLRQEAYMGLSIAIDRFNILERNRARNEDYFPRLLTYATSWIKKLLNEAIASDRTIPVPVNLLFGTKPKKVVNGPRLRRPKEPMGTAEVAERTSRGTTSLDEMLERGIDPTSSQGETALALTIATLRIDEITKVVREALSELNIPEDDEKASIILDYINYLYEFYKSREHLDSSDNAKGQRPKKQNMEIAKKYSISQRQLATRINEILSLISNTEAMKQLLEIHYASLN